MAEIAAPASIVAAALVMQFCLLSIVTIGTLWIRRQEKNQFRFYQDPPNIGRYAWILLIVVLLTIGLLIFSDQFSNSWRPLSADVNFSFITWRHALLGVFVLDIACTSVFVYLTGGSYRSPFAPVYFILPAMALFLREEPHRVIVYSVAIGILFLLCLDSPPERPGEQLIPSGAYAFVSISCLALSVLIGYLTRPH
jgi:hypothetical protein